MHLGVETNLFILNFHHISLPYQVRPSHVRGLFAAHDLYGTDVGEIEQLIVWRISISGGSGYEVNIVNLDTVQFIHVVESIASS